MDGSIGSLNETLNSRVVRTFAAPFTGATAVNAVGTAMVKLNVVSPVRKFPARSAIKESFTVRR